MNETRFFLICDYLIGKEEGGVFFLFRDRKWVLDTKNIIMDRLIGYDASEPADSPYAIGCTSVMDEIEEITYDEAKRLTGGNI